MLARRWSVVSDDQSLPEAASEEEEYAAAFNQTSDPLKQYSDTFHDLPDPFETFISKALTNREGIGSQATIDNYRRDYKQWRRHMEETTDNRHFACPNARHVKSFIRWQRDVRNNSPRTIRGKLSRLSQAYEYWQEKPELPHPDDYNPFTIGQKEVSLGQHTAKEFPPLSLPTFQEEFQSLTNIRRRAIIGVQSKQGLRAGEVCNLRLSEISLRHQELQERYPEMGTHPDLGDYDNVVYIPHTRDGNKSANPRLVPIDGELRWLLIRHLLTRPHVDEPWVFLSKRTFTKVEANGITDEWKEAFFPEYAETEKYRGLTSHFGRHWFSSWLRLKVEMQREQLQYMRGDRIAPIDDFPDPVDDYLHPYYDDIEDTYRRGIFKLQIQQKHTDL
jgi:integrase/recombinase XerD